RLAPIFALDLLIGLDDRRVADQPALHRRVRELAIGFDRRHRSTTIGIQSVPKATAGSLRAGGAIFTAVSAVLKPLGGEEFGPALHEIIVLVHQRVPDGDLGITVPVGAAGTNVALLDDDGAER